MRKKNDFRSKNNFFKSFGLGAQLSQQEKKDEIEKLGQITCRIVIPD